MRNFPQYNFPAFDAAAKMLRAEGHTVFSPAEHDRHVYGGDFADHVVKGDESETPEFNLRRALAADTLWICMEADAIALLPGWEKSRGAVAEWTLAVALGHEIRYL